MEIKTKEYPEGSEIIMDNISATYSQANENISDTEDHLKLSICHQGAGFYFVMETKRRAFNSISELQELLQDFKDKSKIE